MTQERHDEWAFVRALLRDSLDFPELLDSVTDDDDLLAAGVNSGELIRMALSCEEHLGRALDHQELASITSIRAIGRLLQGGT